MMVVEELQDLLVVEDTRGILVALDIQDLRALFLVIQVV
jgi:hypothetical protein